MVDFLSKLRFYSYGIVMEDADPFVGWGCGVKVEDMFNATSRIKVFPTEVTPFVNGMLEINEEEFKAEGRDYSENVYEEELTCINYIDAHWLSFQPFGVSRPMLKRGETVILFQFGDQDRFYWVNTGRTHHMRRLDHYVLWVSGEPDANEELEECKNVYSHVISPIQQMIRSKTSKANDEPVEYDFMMHAGGEITYWKDDKGPDNITVLDSSTNCWTTMTHEGAMHSVCGRDVTTFAPGEVTIVGQRKVTIVSGSGLSATSVVLAPGSLKTNSILTEINTTVLNINAINANVSPTTNLNLPLPTNITFAGIPFCTAVAACISLGGI